MGPGDLLTEGPDVERGLEEVFHRGQVRGNAGVDQVPANPVEHLLGRCQTASRLQNEQAIRSGCEHMQLPVGADVVDSGIGPGV